MSPWYATCGVSLLPIKPGDAVMLQFVHYNTTTKSFTDVSRQQYDACDMAVPYLLPVSGIYDGYGTAQLDYFSNENKLVFRSFKNKAAKAEFFANNDGSLISKWNSLDILTAIAAGRCVMSAGESDACNPIGFMLFRKDIYEKISNFSKQSKLAFPGLNFFSIKNNIHEKEFFKALSWKYNSISQIKFETISALSLVEPIDMFLFFAEAFESLRRGWIPQFGRYNQSEQLHVHQFLASTLLETMAPRPSLAWTA